MNNIKILNVTSHKITISPQETTISHPTEDVILTAYIHTKNVPVAQGKLILISVKYRMQSIFGWSEGFRPALQEDWRVDPDKGWFVPIIISDTEKIEVGDYYYNPKNNQIEKYLTESMIIDNCKKILALPENFSPDQLHSITKNILKNNDFVMIECNIKGLRTIESGNLNWNEIKFNASDHVTIYV